MSKNYLAFYKCHTILHKYSDSNSNITIIGKGLISFR